MSGGGNIKNTPTRQSLMVNGEVDMSHPFYIYDPNQCIACGQCVEVCRKNLQVNETLSSTGKRNVPRSLDDGLAINESSCGAAVNV